MPPSLAALAAEHEGVQKTLLKGAIRLSNQDLIDFITANIDRLFPDIGFSPGPLQRALPRLARLALVDRPHPLRRRPAQGRPGTDACAQ